MQRSLRVQVPQGPLLKHTLVAPLAVVSVVDAVAAAHPELRVTRGRKVLEVRPQVRAPRGCTHGVACLHGGRLASLCCRAAFAAVLHCVRCIGYAWRLLFPLACALTLPTRLAPSWAQVDWDKGTALAHLLELLGLADPERVFCLYIGDDRTDEDAFRGSCATRAAAAVGVTWPAVLHRRMAVLVHLEASQPKEARVWP